jgi:hypothetical protein
MKSVTHYVFSVGVGVYAASVVHLYLPVSLLLGAWLGVSTSFTIDAIGHSRRGDRKVRSWTTHSILTAPIWGALLGLLSVFVLYRLVQISPGSELLAFSAGMGVLAGYSHLVLDSLTEGGVFLGRSRLAIAHLRNNNLILNLVFAGLGILLILAGLG